jgi:1,4-dihydroxy-2-naphthoate octaprenyltransferase
MADRFIGNIPVDIASEMARMNHNVMEEHMLEMIAGILVMTAMLALGAILFVFICAMIGWAIFTMQNGGDDD